MKTLFRPHSAEAAVMKKWSDFKTMRHAFMRVISVPRSELDALDIDRMRCLVRLLRACADDSDPGAGYEVGSQEWFGAVMQAHDAAPKHCDFVLEQCRYREELQGILMPVEKTAGYANFIEREMAADTPIDPDAPEWKAMDRALEILTLSVEAEFVPVWKGEGCH